MRVCSAITLFFCAVHVFGQQQTLFTNAMLNPYLYNPAYAGAAQGQAFNASYRNQWAGFEEAPVTITGSGYGTFKKKPQMAFGGLVMNDKSGLLQRTAVYLSYSYHVRLSKKVKLGLGLSAGGAQYNVKAYNARPYDKDDEFLRSSVINANAPDAGAGLYLHSKHFFLGFSSLQMLNGKIYWSNTLGRMTPHYYAFTGYNFDLDKKKEWTLQTSFMARMNAPVPYQFEPGLRLSYKSMLWIGSAYRFRGKKDYSAASACAMLGASIKKQFSVAYSYDYALSALQQYSTGSHEVMLAYVITPKKSRTEDDKVKSEDEDEFNTIDNSIKTNLKNKKKDEE